jgi:hypothetical protein
MKANPNAPDMVVSIDHHEAHIFHLDAQSQEASEHTLKPHDPHHFRHHLTHKNEDHERGQRASEDPAFYTSIAQELAGAGRIVLIGHGTGHSNAAEHLAEHLRHHHSETAQHLAATVSADLSAMTDKQLLALAKESLP